MGYFGRINYNYKEKYLLEANLRYDGTSKFPSGMKWRWFPSFSAGWRLSEEAFMEMGKTRIELIESFAAHGVSLATKP